MPKGGRREGAGRKAGAISQKTRSIAENAVKDGITPLEYLLNTMRDVSEEKEVRLDAAKSAAPYIHPRLSSIEGKMDIINHEAALNELE